MVVGDWGSESDSVSEHAAKGKAFPRACSAACPALQCTAKLGFCYQRLMCHGSYHT